MANKAEYRRRLFSIYSKNLSHYTINAPRGVFICPICTKDFTIDAVEGNQNIRVDIAHCYPKSCGGILQTLTCKKCNSDLGSDFDSHLSKEHKILTALNPNLPGAVKASVRFPVGPANVDFSKIGEIYYIKTKKKKRTMQHLDKIINYLNSSSRNEQTVKFNMTFDMPESWRTTLALYISAYLMMFREFGYEFVIGHAGQRMRHLISIARSIEKGLKPLLNLPISGMRIPTGKASPDLVHKVGIVTSGDGFRCFFAMLPTAEANFVGRCIIMPGFDQQSDGLDHFLRMPEGMTEIKFHTIGGNPEERLPVYAYRQSLDCCWNGTSEDMMLFIEVILSIYRFALRQGNRLITIADVENHLGIDSELLCFFMEYCVEKGYVVFAEGSDTIGKIIMTDSGVSVANSFLTPDGRRLIEREY